MVLHHHQHHTAFSHALRVAPMIDCSAFLSGCYLRLVIPHLESQEESFSYVILFSLLKIIMIENKQTTTTKATCFEVNIYCVCVQCDDEIQRGQGKSGAKRKHKSVDSKQENQDRIKYHIMMMGTGGSNAKGHSSRQ